MSDEILHLIHAKVEKISEDVAELKIGQAVMQEDVKHHIKRSDMLEELLIDVKEKDIEPLKKDMNQIHGIVKFILAVATVIGVLFPIFRHFSK